MCCPLEQGNIRHTLFLVGVVKLAEDVSAEGEGSPFKDSKEDHFSYEKGSDQSVHELKTAILVKLLVSYQALKIARAVPSNV